jgi:hypothetical protein
MIEGGGNVDLYIENYTQATCYPLAVVEDYHELDTLEDEKRGYTLRVGYLQVESLKGSYVRDVVKEGRSYIITPTESITSSLEMNEDEWIRYLVAEEFTWDKEFDSVWAPDSFYAQGSRIAATAPSLDNYNGNVGQYYNRGVRLIFNQVATIPRTNIVYTDPLDARYFA